MLKSNRKYVGVESFQNRYSECSLAYQDFTGRDSSEYTGVHLDKPMFKTVTFQVTESCNLKCTYCYQINKSSSRLHFEDAKKFIDMLIADSYKDDSYVSLKTTPGIIIDFIGGEPLLEVGLMRDIMDYFTYRCIEENHPWAINHIFSTISNGVKYFDEDVQSLFKDFNYKFSFSISLDGCKELHDKCRVFHNGEGSYDLALAGCKHYLKNYDDRMTTKMTLSPYNIDWTSKAIINMFEIGYKSINGNCVYEEGWDMSHAKILYNELKIIADYMLEHDGLTMSLFREESYRPMKEEDNNNYCGSTGAMLCLTPSGVITPCIRFTKSSLGENIGDFALGDLKYGIGQCNSHKDNIVTLDSITRKSQSTNECFNCTVATGCGWCTGYNFQENGTPNKRVTHICCMHKATSLANVYYWNKFYKKHNIGDIFKMYLPKSDALKIIDENEYDMLLNLSE